MSRNWTGLLPLLFLSFLFFEAVVTVKHENFKTCDQSGFCKRNRAYADHAITQGKTWTSPYTLSPSTVKIQKGFLTATLLKTLEGANQPVQFDLTVNFQENGVSRITIDEAKRKKGDIELRHGSQARKERYNEVSDWALIGIPKLDSSMEGENSPDETVVKFGPNRAYSAVIKHKPFGINFLRDEEVHVKLNGQGLMNLEHWRPKIEKEQPAAEEKNEGEEAKEPDPVVQDIGEDESTWWDETFGGSTDSKPKGPESVGMDITFPGYQHVFGIPGHASSLSLKETRGQSGGYQEPYRLYNSDVFEYEMDNPMTLYGAIPFMQAHRKDSTVGVFWMNAAETWIDINKNQASSKPMYLGKSVVDTETHWFSESGLLDVFVFLGPEPKDVVEQYSALTGYTQLPQQFAIAYHQCRWNYVTDEDVKDVDRKFDKNRIPYDVIWLDIEYTDGKKYFTWDDHTFPDPLSMEKQLDTHDRKLVVIIDPHIKNEGNYPVVDAMKNLGHAVNNKDNNIYEGWCWPGSSHWIDAFSPAARKWWSTLFRYGKSGFEGTAPNTFLWNDMNEPSVFNGPETTMPKDNIHHSNWEHRDVHNLNGLTFVNATYHALLDRDSPSKRPFVLTRSYYSGSQRLGAMWTGDNQAVWSHLTASIPMVLSMNIAAFPFAGADVGGFFGNPSKELLTRWYQAGAFYPFFRGHAHIDTRRREPYLAGSPYTEIITQALRLRYALLPAWYTAFYTASVSGAPIIRPMYYVHPSDTASFAIEDQLYLGATGLLVKPVTTESATSVNIYLPATGETYFDYNTYERYTASGNAVSIAAPLEKIPMLMRAGNIIPRKDRPRRSSGLMRWDPYTLLIVLDDAGTASGELYIDDGESFDYQAGAYLHRNFTIANGTLTNRDFNDNNNNDKGSKSKAGIKFAKEMDAVRVAKLIIVNVPVGWQRHDHVQVVSGENKYSVAMRVMKGEKGRAGWAVVGDLGVSVGREWSVGS